MVCSRCRKKSVIDMPYINQTMCEQCFIKFFEKRVRKTIRRYELLETDDRTAVALSGGKDSMTLLTMLKDLSSKAPKSELFAIILDTGDGRADTAADYCEKLGVKSHVYEYGGNDLLGSLIRRASKLGATKLVLGSNLDDICRWGLLNFLEGVRSHENGLIIRPLRESPEKEVILYAELRGIPFKREKEGDYQKGIRELLSDLEKRYPGTRYQLSTSIADLGEMARESAN